MMIGPNSSGRSAASIMIAHPAWQLPITQGLSSACGMQLGDLLQENRFCARNVLDGLPRHRLRQKSNEIAWMPGIEHDADLAVGLEAADARPVSGARIDDDERTPGLVDPDAFWRDDPRQNIVDGTFERAAVQDQFRAIAEDVRRGLGHMLVILIAALPHHVCEKHGALGGIRKVLDGGCVEVEPLIQAGCFEYLCHHALQAETPHGIAGLKVIFALLH